MRIYIYTHTFMTLKTFLEDKIPEKWKADYKSGSLDKAISCLSELKVDARQYLKSGSTCIVFDYDRDTVIKLCTKRINYYSYFRDNLKTFIDTKFADYFMPISAMVYEDSKYFIYTQGKIRVLDHSEVDQKVFVQTLRMIQTMIHHNAFTPDLISSNFGWAKNGRLYMLDYHDLKPTDRFMKKGSWSKVIRCLMEFASLMDHKQTFEHKFNESWLPWKSDSYIQKHDYGESYFGSDLATVFKTFYRSDKDKIISVIDKYITYLSDRHRK